MQKAGSHCLAQELMILNRGDSNQISGFRGSGGEGTKQRLGSGLKGNIRWSYKISKKFVGSGVREGMLQRNYLSHVLM